MSPMRHRTAWMAPTFVVLLAAVHLLTGSCGGGGTREPAAETAAPESAAAFDEAAYLKELEAWRTARVERLTSETGWLTVVGLHWLEQGENRFGTGPENEFVLPEGAAPERIGSLWLEGDQVSVTPVEGSDLTVGGEPLATRRPLRTDEEGAPDVLVTGRLGMYVIRRDDRFGLRVKDPESVARREFSGLEYFPIDTRYRVEAELVPYDRPKTIEVPTVLGTSVPMDVPGYVRFPLGDKELTLEPVIESDDAEELFFIFKDQTSGQETYPGGRFLYADRPQDGRLVLDFNLAYNPPCAFTAFATCPLPPAQNRLDARIEAGEKRYGSH